MEALNSEASRKSPGYGSPPSEADEALAPLETNKTFK